MRIVIEIVLTLGWILNIFKIIDNLIVGGLNEDTIVVICRVVGVAIVPLGGIAGYF